MIAKNVFFLSSVIIAGKNIFDRATEVALTESV